MIRLEILRLYLFVFSMFLVEFSAFSQNVNFVYSIRDGLVILSILIMIFNLFLTAVELRDIKKWGIIILFFILSLISYFKTQDTLFIQLSLMLFCSINLSFEKIIKSDIVFKVFILLFNLLFHFSGLTITSYFVRRGIERQAFGFIHPNLFGFFVIILIFEIVLLYEISSRMKASLFLLITTPAFILLNMAASRAAQLSLLLFSILFLLNKLLNRKSIIFLNYKFSGLMIFILLIFGTVQLTYLYPQNSIVVTLNNILSNRLLFQSIFLRNYNFSLFGNIVDYSRYVLDNSYLRLLLNYGTITSSMFAYIFYSSLRKAKNNYTMQLVFVTLMFYGLMEWYMLRPFLNIFLVYFMCDNNIFKGSLDDEKISFNNNTNIQR